MEPGRHIPIEDMEVFQRFVRLSDWVWDSVVEWQPFARDTVGKQLVKACDSIGANLVEGDGRHGSAEALRFFVIARASARETRYWLERATQRRLIDSDTCQARLKELIGATQLLNRLINYRRQHARSDRVRDNSLAYVVYGLDEYPNT